MFAHDGKTGHDDGKRKYEKRKKIDHINCNECEEKGHYAGNRKFFTHKKFKENAEALRRKDKIKSGNNPPDGRGEKKMS